MSGDFYSDLKGEVNGTPVTGRRWEYDVTGWETTRLDFPDGSWVRMTDGDVDTSDVTLSVGGPRGATMAWELYNSLRGLKPYITSEELTKRMKTTLFSCGHRVEFEDDDATGKGDVARYPCPECANSRA